jgi:hypothetical protein
MKRDLLFKAQELQLYSYVPLTFIRKKKLCILPTQLGYGFIWFSEITDYFPKTASAEWSSQWTRNVVSWEVVAEF